MVAKEDAADGLANGVHDKFSLTIDDIELDDFNEEELLAEVLLEEPSARDTCDSCLIIDGIPVVGAERLDKLKTALGKLFKKFSPDYVEHYPLNSDGNTKGYCFVEFPTADIAAVAAETLNGYRLDRKHTFSTNLFSDIDKYEEPDPDWQPPVERPYKDHGNLHWWVEQPSCTDQFALQYEGPKNKVSVYYNTPGAEPALVSEKGAERQNWTESTIRWSPGGTYMATLHLRGVALWGAPNFDQLYRFAHHNVVDADFSPCEKYLVTYGRPEHINLNYQEVPDGLLIWHITTGEVLGRFPIGRQHRVTHWPHFRWSFDGKMFAAPKREGDSPGITVFETPSCKKLDGKMIKIERLRDLQFSPTANLLSYWIEEQGALPARVSILRLPDKTELRTMNLFRVADARLYWQQAGDYLAVKVERYNKKRKDDDGTETKYSKLTHQVEIFRINQKDIPVDSVECKEPVVAFGWEPTGDKFCMLLGYGRKSTPTFYQVTDTTIQCTKQLEPQQGLTSVLWSPAGGWLVLASLRGVLHDVPGSGQLFFVDANGSEPILTNKEEHPQISQVQFDPTGRYAVSIVTVQLGERASDFGYRIYSSQGRCLTRRQVDSLTAFHWRPRPKTVLPDNKLKEIKRSMKQHQKRFEEEDKRARTMASKDVREKRRSATEQFRAWHDLAVRRFQQQQDDRAQLREADVDGGEVEEEVIEVPLSTDRTVLESKPIED